MNALDRLEELTVPQAALAGAILFLVLGAVIFYLRYRSASRTFALKADDPRLEKLADKLGGATK